MRQTSLQQRYASAAGQDCSATCSWRPSRNFRCSFGQKYFHYLGESLPGPGHDAIRVQAAHRVGHNCKWVIGDAPYLCYRPACIGERLGAYSGCRFPCFLYGYRIVHTARTARASITCGSYHEVTLLQQLIHNVLGSRARLVSLVKPDYLFNLIGILD